MYFSTGSGSGGVSVSDFFRCCAARLSLRDPGADWAIAAGTASHNRRPAVNKSGRRAAHGLLPGIALEFDRCIDTYTSTSRDVRGKRDPPQG
jgi:hypothetical protein